MFRRDLSHPAFAMVTGNELTPGSANRLWRRVACECEAMAEHAFSEGLSVPVEVAALIDEGLTPFGDDSVQTARTTRQSARDREEPLPVDKGAIASLAKAHAALALSIRLEVSFALRAVLSARRTRPA